MRGLFGGLVFLGLVLVRLRIGLGIAGGDVELLGQLRETELRHHELTVGEVILEAVFAALIQTGLGILELGDALLVQILELAERRDGVVGVALGGQTASKRRPMRTIAA